MGLDQICVFILQIFVLFIYDVAASTGFSGVGYNRYNYYYSGSHYNYYYYRASSSSNPVGISGIIIGCIFTGMVIALACYFCHHVSKKNRQQAEGAATTPENLAVVYHSNPNTNTETVPKAGLGAGNLADAPPRYSAVVPMPPTQTPEEAPEYTESVQSMNASGTNTEAVIKTHDKAGLVENEN